MKEGVGADCAVGTRYSVDTLHGPEGFDLEQGVRFVELVEARGLCDLWDVKVSDYNGWGNDSGPSRFFKAHNQGWAAGAVKAVASVPVVQVGRFTSPDDMADAIGNGECDMIGGARPSIADPFLPKKIEEGRNEDIRECIGCNICVSRFWLGAPMACTQNATAMEEYRRGWHPENFDKVPDPGSVLVVGGGPAGLECTRVLGMRGYDVHLREADSELGGNIKNVMRYPGLAEWGRIVSYRQIQIDKLKTVEVHTGVGEMSADDVLSYGADKVVIAVGAHWRDDGLSGVTHAAIAGADASQPQICTPEQVMAGKETGERVVVIDSDGYFTGIGMAELMADQGKQVTMLTDKPAASYYTEYTLEGDNVQRMLVEKNITVLGNHWVERIEAGNQTKVVAFNVYRDGYKIQMPPTPGQNPRKESDAVTDLDCDTVILVTARARPTTGCSRRSNPAPTSGRGTTSPRSIILAIATARAFPSSASGKVTASPASSKAPIPRSRCPISASGASGATTPCRRWPASAGACGEREITLWRAIRSTTFSSSRSRSAPRRSRTASTRCPTRTARAPMLPATRPRSGP